MMSLFLMLVLLTSVLSYPQRTVFIRHPQPQSPGGLINRPFIVQPQPQTHANLIQVPSSAQNPFSSPNLIPSRQPFPQAIGAQPLSPYSNPRPLVPQTTVSTIQTFGQSIRNPFVPRPSAPVPARPQFQPPRVNGPQTFRRVVTIRQQPLMVQPNYYLLQNPAQTAPAPNPGATAAAQAARNAHLQALSEVLQEYEPNVLID